MPFALGASDQNVRFGIVCILKAASCTSELPIYFFFPMIARQLERKDAERWPSE